MERNAVSPGYWEIGQILVVFNVLRLGFPVPAPKQRMWCKLLITHVLVSVRHTFYCPTPGHFWDRLRDKLNYCNYCVWPSKPAPVPLSQRLFATYFFQRLFKEQARNDFSRRAWLFVFQRPCKGIKNARLEIIAHVS